MLPFCFPVAVEATVHLVTMEVDRKQNGTEAWFSVTCACGCDQGAVIVSLDQVAVWLAARFTEAIERLSSDKHRNQHRRKASNADAVSSGLTVVELSDGRGYAQVQ